MDGMVRTSSGYPPSANPGTSNSPSSMMPAVFDDLLRADDMVEEGAVSASPLALTSALASASFVGVATASEPPSPPDDAELG